MSFPGWPLGTFSVLSQMWNWLMYVSSVIFPHTQKISMYHDRSPRA
jgi:hypothetical protein